MSHDRFLAMKLHFDTYHFEGHAERIILLGPSLGGNAQHQWTLVAEELRDLGLVAFVDLPGHSLSPVWDDDVEPRLENLSAAVMEVVRALRAEHGDLPVFYAGLSISGAIGLHLARDHSDELSGVAVLASAAKIGEAEGWLERADFVEAGGTSQLVDGTRRRWFTPEFQARSPLMVETLLEGVGATDDHSYAQLCRALAAHDVRADLEDIHMPLLLVAGEKDASTPMGDVEIVAGTVPGAELRIIPDAAHQVTVADPDAVAEALRGFITRASRPTAPRVMD